jgi:hypothetical protein
VEGTSCGPPKGILLEQQRRQTSNNLSQVNDRMLGFESALSLRQSVRLVHFYNRKKVHYLYFTVNVGRKAYIHNRNVIRRHRQGHYLKTVFKA